MNIKAFFLKIANNKHMSPPVMIVIGLLITAFGGYLQTIKSSEKTDSLLAQSQEIGNKIDGGGYATFDLIGQPDGQFAFTALKDDKYPSHDVVIKILNVEYIKGCPKDNIGRYSLRYFDDHTYQKSYATLPQYTDMIMTGTEFQVPLEDMGKMVHYEIEFISKAITVSEDIYFKLSVGRCAKAYRYHRTEMGKLINGRRKISAELIDESNDIPGFTPVWENRFDRRYTTAL